jgi:ABC-type sugar transport system substrate-binding protein
LVSQRVNAIIGGFDYGQSMASVGQQAYKAGIPIIAIANGVARTTNGKQQWLQSVDACATGVNQVKQAVKASGKPHGTIGLYTGPPGNPFGALWLPCAKRTAKSLGWNYTLGYTQWTPQGMEQAASQLLASGKNLDAISSDLALSSAFLKKIANSGKPVPITIGGSYTPDEVSTCLSSPKFNCIVGSGVNLFQIRDAVTQSVLLADKKTRKSVKPVTLTPQRYVTAKALAAQVDPNTMPPNGQFYSALSPQLQKQLLALH